MDRVEARSGRHPPLALGIDLRSFRWLERRSGCKAQTVANTARDDRFMTFVFQSTAERADIFRAAFARELPIYAS